MKKQLLCGAIAAALSTSAFAEPTLYGKANVAVQNASEGDDSATELKSNASRLGVKGSLALDSGIEAIYKAEFEVFIDDGEKADDQTFSQRNVYVGLKGGFGTVKAGKFDTPLKVAQKKIDLFNDLEGDIKAVITENDNRESNIVNYTSPSMSGVTGNLALIASEEDGVDDGVSASVAFDQNGLYVAVAFDQNVEAEDVDVIRVVGQYNIGDFQLGAMFEEVDADGADKVDAAFASVKYKIDKVALKAQFGTSDINEEGGETMSIGVDYKLAKTLKLYSYYTQNESDNNVTDDDYLGVGIELKF